MWLDAVDMVLSRLAALSTPPTGLRNASSDTPTGTETEPATEKVTETQTDRKPEPEEDAAWGRSVLGRVRALSVSGQQHGTVFWKTGARKTLKDLGDLGPRETLAEVMFNKLRGVWFCRQQAHVYDICTWYARPCTYLRTTVHTCTDSHNTLLGDDRLSSPPG